MAERLQEHSRQDRDSKDRDDSTLVPNWSMSALAVETVLAALRTRSQPKDSDEESNTLSSAGSYLRCHLLLRSLRGVYDRLVRRRRIVDAFRIVLSRWLRRTLDAAVSTRCMMTWVFLEGRMALVDQT